MIGKKVLCVDIADTYGGVMSDFSLKQYLSFCIFFLESFSAKR